MTAPPRALLEAARLGRLEEAKSLLKQGADINEKDAFGDTALSRATQGRHTAVALLLIESGAELDCRNTRGNTALIWAAMNGNREVVRAMLAKGADATIKNDQGDTALILAKRMHIMVPEVITMLEEALEKKKRADAREVERLRHETVAEKQRRLRELANKNKPKFGP